jgi:hypothetical protein
MLAEGQKAGIHRALDEAVPILEALEGFEDAD